MYAIKVVLAPKASARPPGEQFFGAATERIRRDPQPGIEHVSLVSHPPWVTAMTYVLAADLLEAELLAASAWSQWLTQAWLGSWRLVSCTGDLTLGVWAARSSFISGSDEPGAG
ncbi:hypothetical protein HRW23_13955 [Streptomyces lunaelactis]|uniref:hypothetical protein n=2 Tax=Streptomyces lunaelactis TaxID=1535768 RepID=UPI0015848A4A|nr:hypothetical protein [Streptomyces lunaelactis]NUK00330.1 hypothetical protein [Streptomyces lunaelactis]NUK07169.1 hypothetical protein [Streptomyces lunaelactis]NUK14926.1 hypothetical protein [Streptomyces lunaelactis]NUK22119.1 hypothetical protein [Streptomyces lunaelactis]NUK34257.1 hypothetical protein [Streptomyces lunaelactis]